MFDALQLGMIPLGILSQPITIRYLVDTNFGFTTQDLTLDVPDLNPTLEVLSRFCPSIWERTYGAALSSSAKCSIATVVFWKTSASIVMTVPFLTRSGGVRLTPASQKNSGVAVLHTGHSDRFARRRVYLPAIPAAWSNDGMLNETGKTRLMNQWFTIYMAFKGSALANPYRWLIAYPRVVESGSGNFFGVAFREPFSIRVCSHTAKPPEGSGLDWP